VNSVKIDGQSYLVVKYNDGDTYPILSIENIEKLRGLQHPPIVNYGSWETNIKVRSVIETDDYYTINLMYGVDILSGRISLKLHRHPIGYVTQPDKVFTKKPVFEILTEDFDLNKILLTSNDCKTPQKFLEFVYISLQDKMPNNPF
jgi:hypothetical protein